MTANRTVSCPHCHGTGRVAAPSPTAPQPHEVIVFVARRYRVSDWQLIGAGRKAPIRRPRRIAMWLLRMVVGLSYPDIGRAFNKSDHSSAHVAVKRVEAERTADPVFADELDELVTTLRARYPALRTGRHDPVAALITALQTSADA